MRLWHQALLPKLSTKRLVRQHCECCALRGKGWGRKHATVDYVFTHSPYKLFLYHMAVINEMHRRGYSVNDKGWYRATYRGKVLPEWPRESLYSVYGLYTDTDEVCGCKNGIVYSEHNQEYLEFCIKHLAEKGEIICLTQQ